jgi:hypothetical protein
VCSFIDAIIWLIQQCSYYGENWAGKSIRVQANIELFHFQWNRQMLCIWMQDNVRTMSRLLEHSRYSTVDRHTACMRNSYDENVYLLFVSVNLKLVHFLFNSCKKTRSFERTYGIFSGICFRQVNATLVVNESLLNINRQCYVTMCVHSMFEFFFHWKFYRLISVRTSSLSRKQKFSLKFVSVHIKACLIG